MAKRYALNYSREFAAGESAKLKQAAALRALKEQLDHNEALEEAVRPVPIF